MTLTRHIRAALVAAITAGIAVASSGPVGGAAQAAEAAPSAGPPSNVTFSEHVLAAQSAAELDLALASARRGGNPAGRDAGADSDPERRSRQRVYADPDGRVVDEKGKAVAAPRPPVAVTPRTDAGTAGTRYEPASNYDYCTAHDASYTDSGFAFDRFFLCKVGGYLFTKTVIENGVPREAGRVSIRLTTIVRFSHNSRQITVGNRVDQVQQTGDYAADPATILNVSYSCAVMSVTSCSGTSGAGRSVQQWLANPYLDQAFTPSTGSGLDARGAAKARPRVSVAGAGALRTAYGPDNLLRCDTASYVPGSTRCLMPLVLPVVHYRTSDAAVDEVARHIFEAQVYPERVVPAAGQKIPGRVEGPWLHRIYYDTARRDANRAAAVRQCIATSGSAYSQGGLKSCDEYPFASTAEGAANGDTRWSARVITATDNSTAGSQLSSFYGQQAVLDGDSLAVNITS